MNQRENELSVTITDEGRKALDSAPRVVECDRCRRVLGQGEAYYPVTVGMEETPAVIGAPPESESHVETVCVLTVCVPCEPVVRRQVEHLLATLWDLRSSEPPASFERDPNEPLTERCT